MSTDDIVDGPEDQFEKLDHRYADASQHAASGSAEEMPRQPITDEMLRSASDSADSWLVWNKGLRQRGFAPTDAITPDNVDKLTLEYKAGDFDDAKAETFKFKGEEPRANPIIVPTDPPVAYLTESDYKVHALDARTGKHFWAYQPEMPPPKEIGGIHGWHRGVAVYGDTVYLGLPTVEILALDRYTGEKRWRKEYFSDFQREEMPKPNRLSVTQAPVVYDGKLFIGQTGDFGGWTVMSAIDAESGEPVWRTRTAPHEQWVEETWRYSSTAPWLSPSVDPKSNTVFWAVGNPNPWYFGSARPGPNKYGDSIVALDIDSGDVKWVNQIMPHDVWDYDAHATPTVFDMEIGGETRRVVSTDYKTGWTFVFDAETGRLVERSDAWAKQDHTWAETFLSLMPLGKQNRAAMWPSQWGATEWPPDTYSPETGLRYIGANNAPTSVWRASNWEYQEEKPRKAVGGGVLPIKGGDHWASVVAVDPKSGDVVWEHRLEHVKSKWPAGRLYTGGTTATAGNVVFHGSSSGYLKALHAETGELLWEDKTDRRIFTSPVVWEDPANGKAYVSAFADEYLYTYSLSDAEC